MPPLPPELFKNGKSLINMNCKKYRDGVLAIEGHQAGFASQARWMAKCMAEDCVQSLETIGCRWLSKNRFCYLDEGQTFCNKNPTNPYCYDGQKLYYGGEGTKWRPPYDLITTSTKPYRCSCMKHCSATPLKRAWCVDPSLPPIGTGSDFTDYNFAVSEGKMGHCVCSCGGINNA